MLLSIIYSLYSIHPARLGYTYAPANTHAPANYIPLPYIQPAGYV